MAEMPARTLGPQPITYRQLDYSRLKTVGPTREGPINWALLIWLHASRS